MLKQTLLVTAAIATFFSPAAHAVEATHQNVFHGWVKSDPKFPFEKYVDAYMRAYRGDVWTQFSKNQFELPAKRAETIELMKAGAAKITAADPLVWEKSIEFGEYDFKKEAFAFAPFKDTYIPLDCRCSLPDFALYPENAGLVDGIKLSQEKAKEFLATHIDKYQRPIDSVFVETSFQVVKYAADTSDDKNAELDIKLVRVRIFQNWEKKNLLTEYVAK
jgi:hypothetical protein